MFRIAIRCVRKDGVATAVPDRVSRADPDLVRVMTSVCAEVSGRGRFRCGFWTLYLVGSSGKHARGTA